MLATRRLLFALAACAVGRTCAAGEIEAILASAAEHHASGEADDAIMLLRKATAIDPTASIAAFELGNCLFAPLQAAF